ncbi:hypothetical protein HHI36_023942 [Cryptolaemus montrouzieri]|uniref:Uncharacterized protein n=1 Tax=Cryptolaemus montrouzieri TaxID=559131 RepID=A0ABD2N0J6_9CUCU
MLSGELNMSEDSVALILKEKMNRRKGYYSSSRRKISTATIKNTIPKETKEKKNREKLLSGPSGSDFSISGTEIDLEIDYYDYNVKNAGAAPGSYLGMDPAFLVYIPPLYNRTEILPDEEEGEIIKMGMNMNTHGKENIHDKSENIRKLERKTEEIRLNGEEESIRKFGTDDRNRSLEEIQPMFYESKLARKHLQDSSENSHTRNQKSKIEEFSMIDSNILDEIKYADEDEEEKH